MRGRDVQPLEGWRYTTDYGQPMDELVRRSRVKHATRMKLAVWEQVILALGDGNWHTTADLYRECSPRWRDEVARIREALGDGVLDAERDPAHPTGYRYRLTRQHAAHEQEAMF